MHDIVIRNGTLIDGSGAPRSVGDIAIDGALITQVGGKAGAGQREINADGALVTPGWVDVHTHYDGQVTWDPYLTPSSCPSRRVAADRIFDGGLPGVRRGFIKKRAEH